jgi:hypothetical protein
MGSEHQRARRHRHIRSDNGSELSPGSSETASPSRHQDNLHRPGLALADRLHRAFQRLARRELLDPKQLYSLSEARVVFAGSIDDYNAYRRTAPSAT